MKILLIILLSGITDISRAQTWDEFFKQKTTQKKYLIQQITALRLYTGYLNKGYDITSTGINSIKGFSKGEFSLHNSFYSSLRMVNPAIARNGKIAQIIALNLAISKAFNSINHKRNLSPSEKGYIRQVKSKVMKECEQDIEELLLVITSAELEMKDDERINRLDKAFESMLDKYQFTQSFSNHIKVLYLQKEQEERNNEASKKLYGTTK